MAFIFFDHWPPFLQQIAWYSFVSTIIGYFVTIVLRIVLKIILFHFGFNFNLFPNYFNSFVNPKKMLFPICHADMRSDFFNPISLLFRLGSASFIVYMVYQLSQDEKIVEDL